MKKVTEKYTRDDWELDGRKHIMVYVDGKEVNGVVEMGDGYVVKYALPFEIRGDCIDTETIHGEVWVEEVE